MTDERSKRLAQLRQAYEDGVLDEDTYRAAVAALNDTPAYQAMAQSGAAAQGWGSTAFGERAIQAEQAEVIITGDNNSVQAIIQQYSDPGHASPDPAALREQIGHYLTWLLDWAGTLELRGIQRQGEQVVQLPLEQVYVPLTAALDSSWHAHNINLSNVLGLGKRLILTGGLGSGKTTVLLHAAWALARALTADDSGIAAEKVGFPGDKRIVARPGAKSEPLPLPIFVPLSLYAAHRRELLRNDDHTLAAFISHYLFARQTSFDLPADFFRQLLRSGQAVLLLLDGLDEVPDERERAQVRQAVEDLVTGREEMRVVVTCRTAAYQGQTALGRGFLQIAVRPLAEAHIAALVEQAYAHLYRADPALRRHKTDELLQGIERLEAERRERLGKETPRLIDSPLLVRLLLIVHYRERRLPEQRAELYMKATDAMLLPDYAPDAATADAIGQLVGGSWEVHRDLVQHLAFHLHRRGEQQGREIEEVDLRRLLAAEAAYAPLIDDFVALTRLRGTLLEERLGHYRFLHLAFQEYLAARYLAEIVRSEGGVAAIVAFLEDGPLLDSWWREVILLVAGYFAVTSPQTAQTFLEQLAGADKEATGRPALLPDMQLAAVELAVAAWTEWPAQREELRRKLVGRPLALFADVTLMAQTKAIRRAAGSRALYQLGDPRPDIGVYPATGLPYIVWGEAVPVGTYTVGGDKEAYLSFNKQQVQISRSYQLACYPITYAQFQCFVEAPDFADKRWWEEMPTTKEAYDTSYPLRELREQLLPFSNHPRENVSWYQAIAFCRWLSHKLGYEVDLPHEYEWEVAARYPDGRFFPWGNTFDSEKANTSEGDIGSTTTVDIYRQGVNSTLKLYDLSGNVWEWCRNKYAKLEDTTVDGGSDRRVVRGGSWRGGQFLARATSRSPTPPDYWIGVGFRVVVRRPPSQ